MVRSTRVSRRPSQMPTKIGPPGARNDAGSTPSWCPPSAASMRTGTLLRVGTVEVYRLATGAEDNTRETGGRQRRDRRSRWLSGSIRCAVRVMRTVRNLQLRATALSPGDSRRTSPRRAWQEPL